MRFSPIAIALSFVFAFTAFSSQPGGLSISEINSIAPDEEEQAEVVEINAARQKKMNAEPVPFQFNREHSAIFAHKTEEIVPISLTDWGKLGATALKILKQVFGDNIGEYEKAETKFFDMMYKHGRSIDDWNVRVLSMFFHIGGEHQPFTPRIPRTQGRAVKLGVQYSFGLFIVPVLTPEGNITLKGKVGLLYGGNVSIDDMTWRKDDNRESRGDLEGKRWVGKSFKGLGWIWEGYNKGDQEATYVGDLEALFWGLGVEGKKKGRYGQAVVYASMGRMGSKLGDDSNVDTDEDEDNDRVWIDLPFTDKNVPELPVITWGINSGLSKIGQWAATMAPFDDAPDLWMLYFFIGKGTEQEVHWAWQTETLELKFMEF